MTANAMAAPTSAASAPATATLAVVGGGIVGLATAHALLDRQPGARVIVLEREVGVGTHQSSHNSGVIHAGVYYPPGSLKARLCVDGAAQMYAFCERHGIDAQPIGKLIIATSPDELPRLDELERRGRANGVPGLRRLRSEEIGELEPGAVGVAALHSPRTGIVDFHAVCARLATEIENRGGEVRLGWGVEAITETGRGVRLTGPDGDGLDVTRAVVCAGLWSDRVARRAGAPADPRIIPFRGSYMGLRDDRRHLVRGLIYPVPDPSLPFLGIHFTPTVDGEVLVGPTALLVGARDAYRLGRVRARDLAETVLWPGTPRMAATWWRTGLREIAGAASRRVIAADAARYVPALAPRDLEPAWAGVRAQAVGRDGRLVDDFALTRTARTLHVRNAPSPAATSSLALGAELAGLVLGDG